MWDPGHWNASGLQVLVSVTETVHQYLRPQSRVCFSSERFFFSLLHSLHLLSSSLLSPQSLAPSHTQRWGMQRWLAHSNWVAEQYLSASG